VGTINVFADVFVVHKYWIYSFLQLI